MNHPGLAEEWREFFETLPTLTGKNIKIEVGGPFARDVLGVIESAELVQMDEFVITLAPDARSHEVDPIDRSSLEGTKWEQAKKLTYRITSHYFSIEKPITWQDRLLVMPPQAFAGKILILLQDGDTFKRVFADQQAVSNGDSTTATLVETTYEDDPHTSEMNLIFTGNVAVTLELNGELYTRGFEVTKEMRDPKGSMLLGRRDTVVRSVLVPRKFAEAVLQLARAESGFRAMAPEIKKFIAQL